MSKNTSRRNSSARRRVKGYAPWSPRPATLAIVRQVEEILHDYRSYLPMTVRQIFYRLVAAYGFPKTERDYNRLCEYLVRARRARLIGFDDIRDDGISRMHDDHYANEEHFYATVRAWANGSGSIRSLTKR